MSTVFSKARLQKADDFIRQKVDRCELPGAIAMVYQDDTCVHQFRYGWSDIENRVPLREDHLFRIYSMTKIVSSVATLMLYEDGKLDLNDPVSNYIPAFANQQVRDANGKAVPAVQETTVYDLLRHCSGLASPDTIENYFKSDYTLASFAEMIAKEPLVAQPGTAWVYGYSTDILARIIEIVSEQSFEAFLSERIFQPLGMNDTAFHATEQNLDRLTILYQRMEDNSLTILDPGSKESMFYGPRSFPSASGGLLASPQDFMSFARMLLNNGRLDGVQLLGKKTVEFMAMDHLPEGHPNLQIGNQCFRFGLGVSALTDVAKSRCLSSLGEFGWGGAAGTQVWINPEENLVALIMVQVRAQIPTGIMDKFKRLVYQSLVTE